MNWFRLFVIIFIIGIVPNVVLSSFAQNVITLTTNKNSYVSGDVVTLTGTVANSPNQLVGIQVKDPSGNLIVVRTIQTDANGNFSLTFKVPSTATSGIFGIEANTKINGQTVIATKTFAQAIPEFGSMIGIVAICSIIGVIMISRKLKF